MNKRLSWMPTMRKKEEVERMEEERRGRREEWDPEIIVIGYADNYQ